MMTKETAVMLAQYSNWADQVLFNAMEQLPEGAAHQTRKTLFGSMMGALNHNYQVDLIWRAHLLGEKHGFSSRRDVLHPDFGALVKEQSGINQWYINWAKAQNPESLAESLKFNFISGKAGEMTRGGMFLHIVNHKTYHRGWVSQMFFDVGMAPPETDLCVFLCEAGNPTP
ncbi:DinB family protein [Pusillimonas sp.]|uniref:DinB family protein n=1 Tax=Pusillimonas sp. TaxID=3040095 RepID=UPI0037C5EF18